MEYSYDTFWDAIEVAAKAEDKNEADTAVGFILEAVVYMKQSGMSETELIEYVKRHYHSFEFDSDGNMIEIGTSRTKG